MDINQSSQLRRVGRRTAAVAGWRRRSQDDGADRSGLGEVHPLVRRTRDEVLTVRPETIAGVAPTETRSRYGVLAPRIAVVGSANIDLVTFADKGSAASWRDDFRPGVSIWVLGERGPIRQWPRVCADQQVSMVARLGDRTSSAPQHSRISSRTSIDTSHVRIARGRVERRRADFVDPSGQNRILRRERGERPLVARRRRPGGAGPEAGALHHSAVRNTARNGLLTRYASRARTASGAS